jgi:hypothetical protein
MCATTMLFAETTTTEKTDKLSPQFVAYYCYTSFRCASCTKIENWSRAAIETGFTSEIKLNNLAFTMVNFEETEHKHFVKDFGLYTKSLVITKMAGNKILAFKNLTKVWELLQDEKQFKAYVQSEIKTFITEHSK